ncbi:MAG TPA: aspartate--tRNA ligase [Candidatus Atribacteria bacterium]|nr:aspartate--tRNA ligase [Candidatus Atribacteria bacterium]
MNELLGGLKRTHMCGMINRDLVGRQVTVMGWVQRRRDLGRLIFVYLRDREGFVQVVIDAEKSSDIFDKAQAVRSEYVLAVSGTVVKRDESAINPKYPNGDIEIMADELKILSTAATPPIYIEDGLDASEAVRLKYRYLDLRRPEMQKNLILRHKVTKWVRDFLDNEGFLEIETPMLTKSTPEGARDYLVPSRVHPGKFYALPQSPQLFKQLLMLAGYDRYFQIARCFRDEDLRADRQPEFTQIDMEMSFVDVDDVISLNERLLAYIFKKAKGVDIKLPLPRIKYKEAMERYGSDKPDTRFGLELVDVSDIAKDCGFKVFADAVSGGGSVRAINAKGCGERFSRREIDALGETVKTYRAKGLAWINVTGEGIKSPIAKFMSDEHMDAILKRLGAETGDLLLFVADQKNDVVFQSLGHLRLELAEKLGLVDDDTMNLLWVTEFPLLEYDEEEQRYVAKHHPFTSPMDEDIPLLETQPEKVRAKAYDIVLNGVEIGGGSIRIHSTELQEKMFDALGFTREQAWERFGFLLEAFRYGTPPHGGIAYGLDRLIMLLANRSSLRDVIAFPKVQNASDLMTEAPGFVDDKQLEELGLK